MANEDIPVIAETIIVEGRDDTNSIKRAVAAETIETHGFGIRRETWELIEKAYRTTGIIVFTDPDHAGETIRKRILEKYPDALEAFLDRESARDGDDIGIENASPAAVREALAKVHRAAEAENVVPPATPGGSVKKTGAITMEDLREAGLIGTEQAAAARQAVGKALGIGYGNARAFLRKLNHYRITREDFVHASAQRKTNYKTHDQVRPIKSLGQNFLRDRNVIEAIVDGAGIEESDLCIEIGPGTGALTCGAARRARHLVAVELDRHVLGHLRRELAQQGLTMCVSEPAAVHAVKAEEAGTAVPGTQTAGAALDRALSAGADVEVVLADILKVDLTALINEQKEKDPEIAGATLIGNLPYYITTPIIMKVLEEAVPVRSLTVMMQKEVADRILAQPGTKAYGALSVVVQYYCTVEKVADAPRQCFHPIPKVDSVVLRLDRREEKAAAPIDESLFFLCIRAGFSKRRKTLLNCFTGLFGMDKEETAKQLEAAGIDPSRRGETLSIAEYAALADHFAALKDN